MIFFNGGGIHDKDPWPQLCEAKGEEIWVTCLGELLTGPKNRENLLCVDETPFARFSVSDLESLVCVEMIQKPVSVTACRKGRVVFED